MGKLREGGILIAKIHQVSGRVFTRKLKEHGITEINPAQGRILFVLWKNDDVPIRILAERTMLEKSTLTSMLDRLEESGHITRAPSRDDRREIIISRTDKDRAFQQLYDKASAEMTEIFYLGLSEKERNEIDRYLEKLLANLTATESTMK